MGQDSAMAAVRVRQRQRVKTTVRNFLDIVFTSMSGRVCSTDAFGSTSKMLVDCHGYMKNVLSIHKLYPYIRIMLIQEKYTIKRTLC